MQLNPSYQEVFELRHNNSVVKDRKAMLEAIGVKDIDSLINQTIPKAIRLSKKLDLPEALTEFDFLKTFKQIAKENLVFKSYIGTGYYDTITPTIILRNILENPAWYTAYTPYQAEIAQGRLEMLLNYQTLITDLTGMEIANASLLDEATAAAEAMNLLFNSKKADKKGANTFFVSQLCHPQTIDVLKTRAEPIGITIKVGNHEEIGTENKDIFGIFLQYPTTDGVVYDYTDIINSAEQSGIKTAIATDLLALTLLKPPGEMGASVVVGSSQRFGVPMGYGGPHAAFFATKEEYKRQIPGRIIGVSVDSQGNRALRMALQTREQHIRREKATSNICTAQVLLSIMAAAYAIYHGPEGLKNIAKRTHALAKLTAKIVEQEGYVVVDEHYFDTLKIKTSAVATIREKALARHLNFRYTKDSISISFDETTKMEDLEDIFFCFGIEKAIDMDSISKNLFWELPSNKTRTSNFLTHPVFNQYHSEHEFLRYLKSLESKDLSMVHSMISLGSCTMKLNATTEMIPLTWEEFGRIHPFAPKEQTRGYQLMIEKLGDWLCEITGFAAVSLQPNSGAQGEYAGLMTIRGYHQARGEKHRKIALIPESAHGTNPASAVMAGMEVLVVKCDKNGNIDVEDLENKAKANAANLACLMVTYPSTHGVFEESIIQICELIHHYGGQVYMDGANMNAQVGLTSPASIGADVCHLNLHKTFAIPHGGGGPGMGPIGVASQLVPYLPKHINFDSLDNKPKGAVSAAPFGSASVLTISYAYIAMMGGEGLRRATETAILNANYIKARLESYYPILYTGFEGRVAHEMIVDCRAFKASAGVEAEDIAKRLMDYNFHAPTLSFPVAGTLMIEPTESESKAELDRFCDAMISIRKEIESIENGTMDRMNNPLKNAPHTAALVIADQWDKPYSREQAIFPLPYVKANKFFPSVSRIDSAYGDRNLICSCLPMEMYQKE